MEKSSKARRPVERSFHVLRTILAEADLLMAVDGFPTIADLRKAALTRR